MKTSSFVKNIATFFLFVLLTIPLWLKLDKLSIRMWDESRNAVNALEMLYSKNYFIRTFDWLPETYNLKPPFLTWCQVFAFNTVGVNEIGVRLPSVIASILTLFLVYLIIISVIRNRYFAILGVAITSTSPGFYGDHVGRYGDHDSILVLVTTLISFLVLKYVKTKHRQLLLPLCLLFTIGVYVKSIAVFMMLPAIFFVILRHKLIKYTVTSKYFFLGSLSLIIVVLSYYLVRDYIQPNYIHLVWNDELFPRYFNKSSTHQFYERDLLYYIKQLMSGQLAHWHLLVPMIIPAVLVAPKPIKSELIDALILVVTFLVIISFGTINFWYSAPAIPLLAITISISTYVLYAKYGQISDSRQFIILILLIALPFYSAYSRVSSIGESDITTETNGISYFLRDSNNLKYLNNNVKILLDEEFALDPYLFYKKKIKLEHNINLERTNRSILKLEDIILLSHKSELAFITLNFKYTVLLNYDEKAHLLRLDSHK